jgi:hypothetical protein
MKIIICLILEFNSIDMYEKKIKNDNIEIIYYNKNNYFEIINSLDEKKFDFVMITYNNTYINYNKLIEFLKRLDKSKNLYIGGHGDLRVINNITFHFHSYLPGIILTKSSCSILDNPLLSDKYDKLCLKTNPELEKLYGVAIGYYAKIFNFELIDSPNIHYCNWLGSPCHINQINKREIITCTNMTNKDVVDFEKFLNTNITGFIILPGGGLGNLLFQVFFGYLLAKKYNKPVYYQINYKYWRGDINHFKLFQHLNFIDINTVDVSNFEDYIEPNFYFNEINFDQSQNKNYKISGQFQSYKYYIKYMEYIKADLISNNKDLYNLVMNKYNKLKNKTLSKTCMIHVRRGDYLNYPNVHPVCSDIYYSTAIDIINKCFNSEDPGQKNVSNTVKYLIFSDDLNFVNNWNILKNLDYEIINENDPDTILLLMSMCDNFIIANSSLSLGAYHLRMNNNAKIIIPSIWFGNDGMKFKLRDIILNENSYYI